MDTDIEKMVNTHISANERKMPVNETELERWLGNAYNAGYQDCLRDQKAKEKSS